MSLSAFDLATANEALAEHEAGESDGPIIVVLSTGYADVWQDGEVTQHGVVIANLYDEG